MPDPTCLSIRGLSFRALGREVLNVPKLDIPAAGISVILGPNGAGKSVLMRLMHGILLPSGGDVRFADDRVPRQAMVFQRPVLLRRSVAANIAFALKASGQNPEDLNALLDRAGLTERANQPARTLSGGEQQRLALIRALATGPEILFLDEPTASLDPGSTLAIEKIISETAISGTKVVLVTHNVAQARRLANDVIYCHGGRVVETGSANPLLDNPASDEARDFLEGRLRP